MKLDIALLERCNGTSNPLRAYLEHHLGPIPDERYLESPEMGFWSFAFVLPGRTRYACIRCGNCCRNIHSINERILDGGDCPHLVGNLCGNYDKRWSACRTYPFNTHTGFDGVDLLMLDRNCGGAGKGPLITADRYRATVRALNLEYARLDGVEIRYARNPDLDWPGTGEA
ncbi:MAG TPA: YkgJ family cysteine cluster protein [Holophaga sp.]|nr:YkgJ family cysteine cluster protein [Holophaga sp.]